MPIPSPHPDISIPESAVTPFVLARALQRGSKPALIDGPSGRALTFARLADGIQRMAGGLAQRGLKRGDVVALYCPNAPEYAIAWHGTAWAGGVVTTVNPVYNADELAFQLQDSGARFLISAAASLDTAREAAGRTGVEEVFVMGEAAGATPLAALLDAEPMVAPADTDPGDLVALPYSSGTTGHPKGVMLSHRNLVANLIQMDAAQRVTGDDVVIGVLPFFHIYGMTVIMNLGLERGATIVTMPRFELEQFLRLIQDHRATRAYVVPPIALALAKHPLVDSFDVSSLQLVFCGAAPLGPELEVACAQRLGCRVLQGYGMTEASPVTHSVVNEEGSDRPGTIGPALPNTECRIVDIGSGEEVAPGDRGELWIRGPQVMQGYLNAPDATAATVDGDGWLHTGDVAIVDEAGYFAIVDRVKELIKYKGFQVAPAELEALLVTHPAVGDAAVIPVPDEEAGEIPKAFVVLRSEATPEELMEFVASRVSSYKQVRVLEVVDEIPKSPSGKILRRMLVDKERAKAGA